MRYQRFFSFETASGLSNNIFSTMVRHLDSVVWNSTKVVPLNNLKYDLTMKTTESMSNIPRE